MSNEDYVVSRFKVYADIEGIGEISDIVAVSGTFALNSIPTATLVLACGVEADSGREASAHKIADKVKLRAKVKVFLEVETTDGFIAKMPNQKIMIFEGYYAGFGFQRAHNNANYTMHLIHWLDDLNIGSMMTGNWFPGAPFNLANNAGCWALVEGNGSGSLMAPQIDPTNELINAGNIAADLWGKVIKPVFEKIAKWPGPGVNCPEGADDASAAGELVLEALSKMPGDAQPPAVLALKPPDGGELTPTDLQTAVQNGLTKNALESFRYSTFWSKLVGEYAAQFHFAISPGVGFAQVIPFFGGIKWEQGKFKTIEADEYGYANFMASTKTILEGVNIFWPSTYGSGLTQGTPERQDLMPANYCTPLGSFPEVGERDRRGSVLVKEPPTWLANIMTLHGNAGVATGTGPDASVIGDNVMPKPGDNPKGDDKKQNELQRGVKTSGLFNRYAEHWYKTELLQQRYGEMSGKLRFDIAPGSVVKIKAPRKNMPKLPDNVDLIATVVQVSFVINAEQANAGTSFSLAHIRTDKENDNTKIGGSSDGGETPLYSQGWPGGPLAKELKWDSGIPGTPADDRLEFLAPGTFMA